MNKQQGNFWLPNEQPLTRKERFGTYATWLAVAFFAGSLFALYQTVQASLP